MAPPGSPSGPADKVTSGLGSWAATLCSVFGSAEPQWGQEGEVACGLPPGLLRLSRVLSCDRSDPKRPSLPGFSPSSIGTGAFSPDGFAPGHTVLRVTPTSCHWDPLPCPGFQPGSQGLLGALSWTPTARQAPDTPPPRKLRTPCSQPALPPQPLLPEAQAHTTHLCRLLVPQ